MLHAPPIASGSSANIGSERAPDADADRALAAAIVGTLPGLGALPGTTRRMVERYALDLTAVLAELHRVIRPGGRAILVIGNSRLRTVFIDNDRLALAAAERLGFQQVDWQVRELPPARRYLPPPTGGDAMLMKRMRTESVLTLRRP